LDEPGLAEIGFYHLLSTSLERALPRLLERAWSQGHRIVVRAGSPERVEHLDTMLWTYEEGGFLPHGSVRDGNPTMQPIWLTHLYENPNGASMIVLVDGSEAANLQLFSRCADLFDGNEPSAVEAARGRWRRAREAGHSLTYWQQAASSWERRA
jgi:DNA polymerase-3 subunit chi